MNLIINVADDTDSTFAADISSLCSDNAEGIIYSNLFKDQIVNQFAEHQSIDNIEKHNFNQYSRSLYWDLRQCLLEENVGHYAANRILKIFNKHYIDANLLKDIRTLLGTSRNVTLYDISPGKYVHFGLKICLEHSLNSYFRHKLPNELCLNFNIDGLPITKSSCRQFWPILGSIIRVNCYIEPFVIGIYHGNAKPKSSNEFLKYFMGLIFDNRHLIVKTGAFICDVPARAYIINVKSQTGFNSCTKCIVHGEYYERRVIFSKINCPLRTDSSFTLKEDEGHHKVISI